MGLCSAAPGENTSGSGAHPNADGMGNGDRIRGAKLCTDVWQRDASVTL
jgi:hypothetical protein